MCEMKENAAASEITEEPAEVKSAVEIEPLFEEYVDFDTFSDVIPAGAKLY